MSLAKHNLLSALALCVGAISATACADSTGPITQSPYEGTATVWTGGPDASIAGQSLTLHPSAAQPTTNLAIHDQGRAAGTVPTAAFSLSDAEGRALGSRRRRMRMHNALASDGYDHLEIRPKGANSPASQVTLTRDGHVLAIVDLEYMHSANGWQLASIATTKYAPDGRLLERGRVETNLGARRFAFAGFANALGEMLAPKAAHAMSASALASATADMEMLDEEEEYACGTELRRVVLSIATMAVSGVTNNYLGFFVGAVGFANNLHAYARCMENEQRGE